MNSTEVLPAKDTHYQEYSFSIWHYYHPDELPESNPSKEPNWREKSKGPTKTKEREKG